MGVVALGVRLCVSRDGGSVRLADLSARSLRPGIAGRAVRGQWKWQNAASHCRCDPVATDLLAKEQAASDERFVGAASVSALAGTRTPRRSLLALGLDVDAC